MLGFKFINEPLLLRIVIKRALQRRSAFFVLTWLSFIDHWVELLFFPSMGEQASSLEYAPLGIFTDESASFPIDTKLIVIVVKEIRLPSKILPIVSIVTLSLIVLLIERAPLSLEVKHIVIAIFSHLVDQSSFYVRN